MHSLVGLACLLLLAPTARSQTLQKKPIETKKPVEPKKLVDPKKAAVPVKVAVDKKRKKWQFSLGIGYSGLAKMRFDDVTLTFPEEEPFTGNFDFTWKDTALLNSELSFYPFESPWGISLGASVDLERSLASLSGTIEGLGSPTGGSDLDGQKLMQFILYANGIYRWKAFYAQLGANYSLISYAISDIEAGLQVKGGPGYQAGLGFIIKEKFAAEFNYRQTSFSVRLAESDVIFDFGKGQFTTFIFGLRYFLN